MRLFIAITLTDDVKDSLCETISELRAVARRGRYTLRENLHLTLVFIGETNQVDDILDVMEEICEEVLFKPIKISLSDAGVFKGRGGDLHWIGVENRPELSKLADSLSDGLRSAGFEIEKRRFTPHITIGREITAFSGAGEDNFIRVSPASMLADHISLMRSERVGGKLVYTEIASVHYYEKEEAK